MADSEVRQRKAAPAEASPAPSKRVKSSKKDDADEYSPWLDILRVLSFLFVASCGLSYVISGGETFFWGMSNKPNYLRPDWWKAKFSGPIYLTPKELEAYDGTDPAKPLYLAINGTIYDVSNGRRMYGPGASYNVFTGRDASRGFVTGCFAEDRTADMRGVEEMFLPLDDREVDKYWSTADMEKLREQELAAAKERAYSSLKHWVDFFANSKKYNMVGFVKREPGWPDNTPVRTLCKTAQQGRKKRVRPQS